MTLEFIYFFKSRRSCVYSNPGPFDYGSGALTTELPQPKQAKTNKQKTKQKGGRHWEG